MLSLEMIYDAQRVLRDTVRVTPVYEVPKIGTNIYIKAENLQDTGSFKLRGAFYKIHSLSPEEKAKGVIACSAGNHAQGVAYSAAKNKIKSVICMPSGAPLSKIEATKKYGSSVVLVNGVYDDAYSKAIELSKEKGYTFAHPFDDERVIAGQGTIGLEILQQLPEVDIVVAPIGGGGLISGLAYAIKSIKPSCKVIGVQAENAPSMYKSIHSGNIETLETVSTIADGIAVKQPGNLTFELCKKYVDEIVTVDEDEISTAILTLMETQKTVAEGAGATAVAAVMFDKINTKNKKVCCVISGGNIDVTTLSRVITKGLTKTGRITKISTSVLDKPGQLINLLNIVSKLGANVISINHERDDEKSHVTNCIVNMTLETRDTKHVEKIRSELIKKGYEVFSH